MNRKRIAEVLLLSISLLSFLSSHFFQVLRRYFPFALFFGVQISLGLFVDVLLTISILLILTVITIILKESE